jgi:cell division protein FtsI (penicillin-binding protein 3)
MERTLIPPLMAPGRRPPAPHERQARLRLMLMALSITLWGLVMLARLLQLQVLGRASFERLAARQSERTIVLDPRRGALLDRNGRPLAVSVEAESVYAVPQEIANPERTAQRLASALGLDAAGRRELKAQLARGRAFVWVKRKLDPATARAVRALQLDGIGFLTETRRYYPKRELAAQVLGWAGVDNIGMSGIEYAFDEQIRGRAAKVTLQTDARRRPVGHAEKPSTEGHSIVLTLDEAIQHVAERELAQAVSDSQSIAGVVVVMDPRSGEILALANRPTFNPNRFGAYSSDHWRNRAVADAYEPGSVFKVITAAAALQEKVVGPDEVLDCGHGGIEIAGVRINDHAVFDDLRFRDVISKSSDVGVIRVAQRLGREQFHRYVRAFGFGAVSGIALPGESSGLLKVPAKWSALSLASMSFGQEVGVTAVQLTAALGALANGGYLMKPQIVRRIEDPLGNVVKEFKPLAVRRVVDPETVELVGELLKGVVREGTGRRAAIPGYVVAGKTGTAQKVDSNGRYSMVDHVASFGGYVPASRPALVILVSLDTPKGPRNEGGDLAAPLFARIAEQALRRLAVTPDDPDRSLRVAPPQPAVVTRASYQPPVEGAPALRAAPRPAAAGVAEGERGTEEGGPGVMPDLRGHSAREGALAAARRGLIVELRGSGEVVGQSPAPGTEIEPGLTCVLALGRAGEPAPPLPASDSPAEGVR